MSDPTMEASTAAAATTASPAPAGPGELKRSTKVDFAVARERSFVRQGAQHQTRDGKRKSTAMPSNRGKPTMEIYRPPNVRTDIVANGVSPPISARLNVHAKEFTMKSGEISTSKSNVHIASHFNINNNNNSSCRDGIRHSNFLQTSKSSGNILHIHQSKSSGNMMHSLAQSVSSGNVLQGPRVHFQLDAPKHNETLETGAIQKNSPQDMLKSPVKSCSIAEIKSILSDNSRLQGAAENDISSTSAQKSFRPQATMLPLGLKRSKSLGAADMIAAKGSSSFGLTKEGPDLGSFPREIEICMQKAMEDPNKVPPRMLMELVRHIMDRVVVSVSYALPGAKLCISIIEKEKKETFLETLLNTCQQWYQERDRVLRSSNTNGSNQRYCAFMHFLNEMYCELKRRQLQLKTQYEGVPPGLVLLTLLYKSCQDCLKPPNFQGETDSLFFVLTSVGRDLEQELPGKLQQLLASIRDAFLSIGPSTAVKKTLLQLIELHASKWQLPASAVMYYTTSQ